MQAMRTMAARFGITVVLALVVSGFWAATAQEGVSAAETAVPQVVSVCRVGPITASHAAEGASQMTFVVQATNAGNAGSSLQLYAGINQPLQIRQKGPLAAVTLGGVNVGEVVQFRLRDPKLFPGVRMTVLVAFMPALTSDTHLGINATFSDPWSVPKC